MRVMYVVLCNDNKASQIMTTQRTEEVHVAYEIVMIRTRPRT